MKKTVFAIFLLLILSISVSATASSTSEALTSAQVTSAIFSVDPVGTNPPYGMSEFPEEYIEPMEGSLTLTEDILYLPGKNGFDVNLTATYNSQNLGRGYGYSSTSYEYIFEKTAYYYTYTDSSGNTRTILVCPDNEEQMLTVAPVSFYAKELPYQRSDDLSTKFYFLSDFDTREENILFTRSVDLGKTGLSFTQNTKIFKSDINTAKVKLNDIWKLNIPFFGQSVRPTVYRSDDEWRYYTQYTAFIDFDNAYRKVELYHEMNIETGEYCYFESDVLNDAGEFLSSYVAQDDITHPELGISYVISIQDSIGRTMYFNQKGYITAITDRFCNVIKYTFNEDGKLTRIVDTLGKIITFEYTDTTVMIYVDADGEGLTEPILHTTIETTFVNNATYDPSDYLVSDNEYTSRIIRYEDSDTVYEKKFEFIKRHQAYYHGLYFSYHEDWAFECPLITRVSHPNGLTTNYNYERTKFTLETYYYKDLFPVVKRWDVDNNSVYNEYTYTYDPGTETVKTRLLDGTTETYEGENKVETKTLQHGTNKYLETYEHEASLMNRKITTTTQSYSSDSITGSSSRVISTPYDSLRPTGTSYDDYAYTITYHDDSLFPATEVYNQNENLYVKTTYTLSEQGADYYTGRTLQSKTVSESTDGGNTYTDKYIVEYTYNTDGTLASETVDPDGINQLTTYSYTYNDDGSITTTTTIKNLTDADGNSISNITTSATTDYLGRVILSKDGNGNITTYEYDNIGRLILQTNPDDTTITYEYDTLNRTVISTNEDGIKQKVKYDGFGNVIAVYKNASETTIRWALVSEVEYDALCRPIVSVDYTAHSNNIPTKWTETHYSYTAFDHVEEISVYDENLTELSHKTYTYNFVTRIGTTDNLEAHDVINDGATQKFTSVTVETDAKDGITPPTVTQFIDRRGRVVKQIRTDGTQEYISTYVYDATGNILEAKDEAAYKDYIVDYSEKYEYNYLSKVTRAYNAEGNCTETVYDNLGRTISQTDYMGNTTTYTYDSIGRMLTSSTPVDTMVTNLTRYYYDSNSNKIREICPMASGTVTYNYAYDSRNRLVSSFNGSTYTLNEYEGNQLIRTASGITNPENVEISELSPTDATYNVTLFNYNHLGFISSETTFNGITTYTYDLSGKTLTSTDPKGITTTNTYDSSGNLLSSTASDDVIEYTYNSFNLVTEVSRGNDSTTYTYDNFGRNTTETTGTKVIARTYNTQGQVASMILKDGETVLQTNTYEYNVSGKMTSASDGEHTVTYTYNENGFPVTEEKDGFITSYTYTNHRLASETTSDVTTSYT